MQLKILTSIAAISENEWNRIAGENPVISHAYLLALEETGCASPATGWTPQFLAAYENDTLLGALPLYLKTHSYGEFVFDWAWADAYAQNGLNYYPKLVSSVPFTPVSGPRVLAPSAEIRKFLIQGALQLAKELGVSSFHCLFPDEAQVNELLGQGMVLRHTLQFHWENAGFQSFDDFLASMRHGKRKNILKERRKLSVLNISFERIRGDHATDQDWKFFYQCYLATHKLYQSPIPLTLDFFLRIAASMPKNILLVFASRNGERIAAAFDLFDSKKLYGRSWGALEYIPGLHFEVCYYQAIEFCIQNKLTHFEGGAQGEHKLARGLLPVTTVSAHWLAHPEFFKAVEDFLQRETGSMIQYVDELNESNPFKIRAKSVAVL